MDRLIRMRKDMLDIAIRANKRWKGFQPLRADLADGVTNQDGSLPHPEVAAPTSLQKARNKEREQLRAEFNSPENRILRRTAERQIGATLDFTDLPPNEQALKAGRPVARIVLLGQDGYEPFGYATGFLIAPDLLLTNYHVLGSADEAHGVGAQFLFEKTQGGVRTGLIFELDPDRFFLNYKDLDYAVVAVKPTSRDGAPLSQFQHLPLIPVKGKILKGDPVNIIQHPEGGPKKYATVNNRLLDLRDDGLLLYETDTLQGSSGSPVFNQHWEVVGLHHRGVPLMDGELFVTKDGRRIPGSADVEDSDLVWFANEGIRVSALVASLADQHVEGDQQQAILAKLIASTEDPLRMVERNSPMILAKRGRETASQTGGCRNMAQNVFECNGPVTINIMAPTSVFEAPVDVASALSASSPPPPDSPASLEKRLRFDENYKGRDKLGYDVDFLNDWSVPVPGWGGDRSEVLTHSEQDSPWVIPYYHFSLALHRKRRLAIWVAGNVSYCDTDRRHSKSRKKYGTDTWRLDPRVSLVAPGLQIEDAEFYAPATRIDRGHLMRREDGAWGKDAYEAEYGNSDTFHWTNCTPQSEAFNRSNLSGIWGAFEEHIQRGISSDNGRMNVLCGPVLNVADPFHGYDPDREEIQVPLEFWKVVACTANEGGMTHRFAYGFVFDQREAINRLGFERMNMNDYKIFQVPIATIEKKTQLQFDQSLHEADVMKGESELERITDTSIRQIASLESVILR